jgi:hypothetical protein
VPWEAVCAIVDVATCTVEVKQPVSGDGLPLAENVKDLENTCQEEHKIIIRIQSLPLTGLSTKSFATFVYFFLHFFERLPQRYCWS